MYLAQEKRFPFHLFRLQCAEINELKMNKHSVMFKKNLHVIIKCSYDWTNGRITGGTTISYHHLPHFIDLYVPKSHAH